jgi:hypothetical protein
MIVMRKSAPSFSEASPSKASTFVSGVAVALVVAVRVGAGVGVGTKVSVGINVAVGAAVGVFVGLGVALGGREVAVGSPPEQLASRARTIKFINIILCIDLLL